MRLPEDKKTHNDNNLTITLPKILFSYNTIYKRVKKWYYSGKSEKKIFMEEICNIEFSSYSSIMTYEYPSTTSLGDFINGIRNPNPMMRNLIGDIRKATTKAERDPLKIKLPCCTPSGLFTARYDNKISKMSGLICLDLDHIKDVEKERNRLIESPIVLSIFRSPSGDGLKVLIRHDLVDPLCFKNLYSRLGAELGCTGRSDLVFDLRSANISHACFFSHDPDIYFNGNARIYHFDTPVGPLFSVPSFDKFMPVTRKGDIETEMPVIWLSDPKEIENAILKEHEWFEQYNSFYEGNRNNKLFILSRFFKEARIPEDTAVDYLTAYYANPNEGFPANEIVSTVRSAYTK